MARIRTIKPQTFRHEGLQDLERAHPGAYTMLVFVGLWGHCDKGGKFEWKPRQLKLDILPFLEFDMAATLGLLRDAGQIEQYTVGSKEYGRIKSFPEHQRIGGKEAQEDDRFPNPSQGTTGEATEKHLPAQEGKGREKEGKGERAPAFVPEPNWQPNAETIRLRLTLAGKPPTWTPTNLQQFIANARKKGLSQTANQWDEGFAGWMLRESNFARASVGATNGAATAAYVEVRQRNRDGKGPGSWSYPQTDAALTAIGGWGWVKNADSKSLDFKQREFEAAFNGVTA